MKYKRGCVAGSYNMEITLILYYPILTDLPLILSFWYPILAYLYEMDSAILPAKNVKFC